MAAVIFAFYDIERRARECTAEKQARRECVCVEGGCLWGPGDTLPSPHPSPDNGAIPAWLKGRMRRRLELAVPSRRPLGFTIGRSSPTQPSCHCTPREGSFEPGERR